MTKIVRQVGAVRGLGQWLAMLSIVLSGPTFVVGAEGALDVRRFAQNPIIRPPMLPGREGGNINGPSLIRVSTWVPDRLGSYYLYFAHHNGKYIRLAYADKLEGPWRIYEPGALALSEASSCTGHIASPDVHVDEARHEIRMYFHGPAKGGGGQKSFVAVSKDGLHFRASSEALGLFYFRAFSWQGAWYAMAKGGLLYRSKDGLTGFEQGPNPFPGSESRGPEYNQPGPRHVALHRIGDVLWVYYSNIGDEPERILRCSIQLAGDWNSWKASAPEEVLRPHTASEGADLPLRKSVAGAMQGPENALRDPALFTEADGRVYLLYSVAGESGIGLAELKENAAGGGPATMPVGQPIPSWFPKAVPLPPPQGEVIRVATVAELLAAVERMGPGATILLADGQYRLPRVLVLQGKKDIMIRSAGGDPAKVVLSGKGWDSEAKNDDIFHIGRCEGVTIADLTFADCRSYGIKVEAENGPKDIHIYNCRFRDIGVRAIKGSGGQDPNVHAVRGFVRYCRFENTKVPPADWLYGGDYIAAIDMMALDGWTFSDNVFRNIKGRNGGGRAAIFIWVRSQRVVVERNLIIDCDRGVAFGNPGPSTANNAGERLVYVSDGIIRNNFIVGGPDCGIELWYTDRIKVYNNSIWRPDRNWNRGIRVGTGSAHTEVVNNLVHGEIRLEGGEADLRQNLTGRLDGYFVDPASGNLALTSAATKALDQGASLPDVTDDIRGRPRHGRIDLGAWESDDAQAQDSSTYTTYGSFAELMAGEKARYPKLVRVSDPGTKERPDYTGFFFYQCLQFDPTDRYLLGMKVHCQNRDVRPTDRAEIGLIDLQNGYKWTQIGETTAWNWQQGARLQWRPGSDEILWNDRAEDGARYVCRLYNFKTGARRTLPRPVYTPSPDGTTALTHDFERMKHAGTPYVGIADKYAGQLAPKETGIWKMDLNTGEAILIVSLEKMAQIAYRKGPPTSGCLYIFREGWNPSGTRFIAFLKDPDNQFDKAFTMTPDGTDIRYFYNLPSHHEWRDDRCVLDGRDYYLYEDDGTGQAQGRLFKSSYNGHVSYIPGPGGDWIISDTYAVNSYQYLFMYHIPTQRFVPLAKLKSTAPTNVYRVDLHPRLSRDRRMVSIDATHEDLGRQMYVIDIGPILDHPPADLSARKETR